MATDNDRTIDLLNRAADLIEGEAGALRLSHSVNGDWGNDIEDRHAQTLYDSEMTLVRDLRAESQRLRGPLQ